MPLAKWQKYLKASPCPVCGGWSLGKKKDGTRCKGYRHGDKKHVFCQNTKSQTIVDINGLKLYKHTYIIDMASQEESKPALQVRQVPRGDLILSNKETGTAIYRETLRYEGLMVFGFEQIPETRTWYVVYRNGEELTRDLTLNHVRGFCL